MPFSQQFRHALAVCLLLLTTKTATATLQAEMAPMARDVADLLKELGHKTIALGPVAAPTGASAGPGIQKGLADELTRLGIEVKDDAPLRTQGTYALVTDKQTKLLAARVTVSVQDKSGKGLGSFKRDIKFRPEPDAKVADGATVLGPLLAVTGALPPEANLRERQEALLKQVETPQFHAKGTLIAAADGNPYTVEIMVDGQARKPANLQGQAFVEVGKNEVYAVRLVNNSDLDAAATLTIDGLSMFAFSDHPGYVQVIVPAKSAGVIRGWHRTNEKSETFQVKAYPESAAAQKLVGTAKLGTITATFAAAWPKNEAPPKDEAFARLALNRGEKLATGRGPELSAKFQEVERHVGVVRAMVTVRYTKGE